MALRVFGARSCICREPMPMGARAVRGTRVQGMGRGAHSPQGLELGGSPESSQRLREGVGHPHRTELDRSWEGPGLREGASEPGGAPSPVCTVPAA